VIKVLVPISGGKDSQACLKLALESYSKDQILCLFCDTQFEHPKTYQHVDFIELHYGVKIEKITSGSVEEKCRKYKRFPGGGARHCTDELKIAPTKRFCKELAQKQGGFEVWYGMRSEESFQRAKRYNYVKSEDIYAPHEIMPGKYPKYLEKLGVMFRLPIMKWTREEVLLFLEGKENPLYSYGFDRVGCFPCQAAGDPHKEKSYSFDEFGKSQYIKVKQLSEEIGKPMFTSKGGCQRNNPDQQKLFDGPGCSICSI
jgi:3'-phosphoadenosine 5'-phosphosulfate sulfotransferase (PAPS reductase)/FAD synthetase